jgi:hypothetical protein
MRKNMAQVQCSLLEMPIGLQDLAQLNHLSKTEVINEMLIRVKKWGALCRSLCHYLNVQAPYFNQENFYV